ncbi:ArnT family glycosyltransferase [Amycolatopsis cihanbeyliensis]|uniref:Dolichyl-phosphate-mannose-protein mannosyltransferase n=1 Tax=Amycolatopsis cihanbeyliensis TaxID=1128664 RepID=A0A542CU36_AMYCI|nr:glycosyltransferase family 39 protein [Amycolatopsis cihanbeyliensis]TQI94314.1 dolichyl-phosphate-mannose-protein mannosyltransferase [Amycolatopsis cihanbeyliensis]
MPSREITDPSPERTVSRFALGPVLTVAGAAMAVLLAFAGRYGYHGDELYFISAGKHLDWGYADQPPLVPLLARAMDLLFPDSVVGFRLLPILLTGAGIVVAALTARELGGGRLPQLMTAGAYACSPFLLAGAGHIVATHTVDAFLWTVTVWLLVHWVRLRDEGAPDDRWLLGACLVTALALQTKFLIPIFWVLVAITALILGPRDLLRRPLLWVGAAIAVVTTTPTLIWQAAHGWPQLEMNETVAQEVAFAGGRSTFLSMALHQAGVVVGAVLFAFGTWWLLRSDRLRPYRFLGWTVLGVTAVFWINAGRPYYVGGLFALCFAAGAVEMCRGLPRRWLRWGLVPAYAVSAAVAISGLPITPVSEYTGEPYSPMNMALEEFGWPQVAEDVANAYWALPPERRANVSIVTDSYWQAAAVEKFAADRGLPPVHSGSRGAWYFGAPSEEATSTLFVGADRQRLLPYFAEVRQVASLDNEHRINNSSQGAPVWLCTGRVAPWAQLWPEFRHMTFRW